MGSSFKNSPSPNVKAKKSNKENATFEQYGVFGNQKQHKVKLFEKTMPEHRLFTPK